MQLAKTGSGIRKVPERHLNHWKSCDARTNMFNCRKGRKKSFQPPRRSVMIVLAFVGAGKLRESLLNHCGGRVKLLRAFISVWKVRQSHFKHGRGSEQLAQQV